MLPFFRDTDISLEKLTIISDMLAACRVQRGILLVTPEHRMCLQLKAREVLLDAEGDPEQERMLREINAIPAVDLLDESDEILRHGTELNYAIGEREPFDGHQLRWQMVEFFIKTVLLDVDIRKIVLAGKARGFTDVNEKQFTHGGVPYILLLDENYYNQHIRPLLFDRFVEAYKALFLRYVLAITDNISDTIAYSFVDYMLGRLTAAQERRVLAFLKDKPDLKMTVLVAKGLLSHDIIFYVFNAPYRVKYGLDFIVGKKPVALPFVGKDIPSERSEFSHPDIILGFTLLSYLYQGLSQEQLKAALLELNVSFSLTVVNQYLQKWFESDRDGIEERFGSFPNKLTHFENLDLNNAHCLEQLHLCLHGNVDVILFYVNRCILPNHAHQYRHKISANAHSIVGHHAALGFSGTDDRRITMPHGVQSRSLNSQQATDGKLLAVMTKPANRRYISVEAEGTVELLKQFCKYVRDNPNCHILIDAGALIMGMDNYHVALFLMKELPPKFKGVIYFSDKGNALMVLMRNGAAISLEQCQLEKHSLFAYLDDIHTRGTDLKLPLTCIGMLTIGLDMEKDKYVQAAMRLRNLAQQQSLVLWGLSKVTAAIVRGNRLASPKKIDSLEVLKWTTANTIRHINDDLYFVAVRKISFCIIKFAENSLADAPVRLEAFMKRCQEEELFALEEFYGFSPQSEDLKRVLRQFAQRQLKDLFNELREELGVGEVSDDVYHKVLSNKQKRKILSGEQKTALERQVNMICEETEKYLGVVKFQYALDASEEKEVQVEVVHEQTLTAAINEIESCEEKEWNFAMVSRSDFITSALHNHSIIMPLKRISHYIASLPELAHISWHPSIYITNNFVQTVKTANGRGFDNYLRLVDMVLVHRSTDGVKCVLISGYEASRLIKDKLYSAHNILVHIKDVNGPTQLPLGSQLDEESQKLLTIVKLFAGECHYDDPKEVKRLAKRVGRICPDHFVSREQGINEKCSEEIYGILITKGYLTESGTMTPELLQRLDPKDTRGAALHLGGLLQPFGGFVFTKLLNLTKKLIIYQQPSIAQNQFTLWRWVEVRKANREYPGSELESVLNPEKSIKSMSC